MAASSLMKVPCATDNCKSVGILKCEGCVQTFCRKHVNEHRDMLSQQFDEIVFEHDTIQQAITKQNDEENDYHVLLEQIDRWATDSIIKIERAVDAAREQVKVLMNSRKG